MAEWKKVVVSGSSAALSGVSLDTALTVGNGGTGATSLTDGGVLLGSGTGAVTALGQATNGQLVIGSTGADPVLGSIGTTTSKSGSLEITGGAGSIKINLAKESVQIGNLSASNAASAGKILSVADDGLSFTFADASSGDVTAVRTPSNTGLAGGDTSGNVALTMSIDNLAATTLGAGDTLAFHDASESGVLKTKKVTLENLSGSILNDAATGSILDKIAGDVNVTTAGVSTIQAGAVESGMLNDNVISGQSDMDSATLASTDELLISDGGSLAKIDVGDVFTNGLHLVTEAAATVADDYMVFLDGGATGEAKKEKIADLVSAQAGKGLSEASGQFNVELTSNAGLGFTGAGAAGTLGLNLDTTSGNDTLQMDSNGLSLKTTIEGNRTFSGDVITINNDLKVAGTASFTNASNLSVADKYILLNSGSDGSSLDSGGIVIQGPTQDVGEIFGFTSGSSDSDTTRRWAVANGFNADTSADFTPQAFMANVVIGGDDTLPTGQYAKKGNIFVGNTSGTDPELYIYA